MGAASSIPYVSATLVVVGFHLLIFRPAFQRLVSDWEAKSLQRAVDVAIQQGLDVPEYNRREKNRCTDEGGSNNFEIVAEKSYFFPCSFDEFFLDTQKNVDVVGKK